MSFPEPRPHLYLFAHSVFVDRLFKSPERMWERLTSERALATLAEAWDATAELLDPAEILPTPTFDLALRPGPTPDRQTLLIHMPPPEQVSECHAIALVHKVGATRFLFLKAPADVRMFVLERGYDNDDGTPRAYVAEYRAGRERLRMDDVPVPDEAHFLSAIADGFGDTTP